MGRVVAHHDRHPAGDPAGRDAQRVRRGRRRAGGKLVHGLGFGQLGQ